MLTEEQQAMLWAAVEKMEESNQRTYALLDELRASAQRLAATSLALVSAYQDGSGKQAATTPTPSSSSSSTTAEKISGVVPVITNSMSTTTSLVALVPSPTSDPPHDAAPATSIATTGTPAGDTHQVFDAGPISGHLRSGICVLAPVMFKEVVSLEVLNKLNMLVTIKSSTPSSARYFSDIPTAAVPMLEMCMSDVAKQRPTPWPSFNYCQAQVQLIAASIDGILTIACQMMNSASRILFHIGQPSNYLQSVEPLSQMVLDGCIRKRRDFILLDSSGFRKEQTSKMPKPPWSLCAEVFCSWFGRMHLIGGLLLEASPWYREYLLFVQWKTPGPPTVWFCSTEARTTEGAVRRLVHSFLKLISENSALYAWESSDVVQVPLLDPLELLQLEYEVALLIDQLFKRIISCTTEGVQLISATKPSVVLTHGSNTAIILHSWRYYAASEVGVQLVIIQEPDDNKVFGMGIIQNWVTCVIEKLQLTWDPGDSTTMVNNAASMEKVTVKEQSTSWIFLQNGNNILGVYTSSIVLTVGYSRTIMFAPSDSSSSGSSGNWLFKNKEHGKANAAASLGMILLWNADVGLAQLDKYLHSNDTHVVAGALLGIGIVTCSVKNDCDPALAILKEYINKDDLNIRSGAPRQVLVQWSTWPESLATWEDEQPLKTQFPEAPAWGQAGFQGGKDVSTLPVKPGREDAAAEAAVNSWLNRILSDRQFWRRLYWRRRYLYLSSRD